MKNAIIFVLIVIVIVLLAHRGMSTFSPAPSTPSSALPPGFTVQDQYTDTIVSMVKDNQPLSKILAALQSKGLTAAQAYERVTKDEHFGHKTSDTPGPPTGP